MVDSTAENASENRPEGERPAAGTPASSSPSPGGRRAGLIVYWLLIAFVIGFGVRSITLQIFWPPTAAAAPGASCGDGLRELVAELRAHTAVAAQASDATPDAQFFLSWDARYHAIDPLCEGDMARSAYGTLARYRYSLEQSLVRHRRDETELSRDLDARLAALRP